MYTPDIRKNKKKPYKVIKDYDDYVYKKLCKEIKQMQLNEAGLIGEYFLY